MIAPAPLTSREEELQEIKRTEVHTEYSLNTKHQVSGLAFPITDSAAQAIRDMERGTYDYLQFAIGKYFYSIQHTIFRFIFQIPKRKKFTWFVQKIYLSKSCLPKFQKTTLGTIYINLSTHTKVTIWKVLVSFKSKFDICV